MKVKVTLKKVQTCCCICYPCLTSKEEILKEISEKVEGSGIKCSVDVLFDICFNSFTGIF